MFHVNALSESSPHYWIHKRFLLRSIWAKIMLLPNQARRSAVLAAPLRDSSSLRSTPSSSTRFIWSWGERVFIFNFIQNVILTFLWGLNGPGCLKDVGYVRGHRHLDLYARDTCIDYFHPPVPRLCDSQWLSSCWGWWLVLLFKQPPRLLIFISSNFPGAWFMCLKFVWAWLRASS